MLHALAFSSHANEANAEDAPLMQVKLVPKTFSGGYHLTCFGGNDGSIQTVVTDGTAPYTYVWSTGATTETLEHAIAGTYSVTVTDAQGVTATASIDLLQPKLLEVEATSKVLPGGTHISKAGGNDGKANADVMGGTPPYTYLWSTTDGTAAVDGSTKDGVYYLEAGTYTVTVEDVNGCSVSASVTLTEPTPITANLSATTYGGGHHVSCAKGEDGAIDLTVNGGIAPYKFDWTSGHFTEDVTGLKAGYHEVRITDANGAKFVIGETLTEPAPIEVTITSPLFGNGYNVSCHSCYNGTVNSAVSGGVSPYIYDWQGASGSVGQAAQLQNAGEAEYALKVVDANGCLSKAEVKLKIPERDDWRMGGNANVQAGQFLGTTDATDVEFRANNQAQLRLGADGVTEVVQQLRLAGFEDLNAAPVRIPVMDPTGAFLTSLDPDMIVDAVEPCKMTMNGVPVPRWVSGEAKIYTDCNPVNIGIGTDNPAARLDVKGQTYSQRLSVNTFDEAAKVTIRGGSVGSQNQFKALEVQDTDGEAAFQVYNDGKVMVSRPLTQSGDEAILYLGNTDHKISSRWGKGLSFSTFGADNALVIEESTGKVGIGVGENHVFGEGLLEVNGTIRSQKVIAEVNGWPDYVFVESYNLMQLSELRVYINRHGHLPDIPSAEQVKNDGLDLGELVKLQMQKIEELTLYILALEERFNEKIVK
ncbi:MAG: hypothetical protein ACI9LA_000007 [Bacteroidia bacterium]